MLVLARRTHSVLFSLRACVRACLWSLFRTNLPLLLPFRDVTDRAITLSIRTHPNQKFLNYLIIIILIIIINSCVETVKQLFLIAAGFKYTTMTAVLVVMIKAF